MTLRVVPVAVLLLLVEQAPTVAAFVGPKNF